MQNRNDHNHISPSLWRMGMKRERLLFLLFLPLLLLACCTTKNAQQEVKPKELQPLTLGLMPSMDGLPFVVAQQQGFYDSLGIKVNFIQYYSPIDRDAALQSGSIDGAITDYSSAILLQAKGTHLGLVIQTDGYCQLIAGKESQIRKPEQLKEKNIAVSHATIIEYATDQLLAQAGIASNQVNKPEINNIPLRLTMLENGQIDATFLPAPYACMAMNNGGRLLGSTRQMKMACAGTAFNEKALKEKAEEIKRLITGYNLGVEYLRKHPVKEWSQLIIEETGLPETQVADLMLPVYHQATRPDSCDIAQVVHWLQKKRALPEGYSGKNLVDTAFAPKPPKSQ